LINQSVARPLTSAPHGPFWPQSDPTSSRTESVRTPIDAVRQWVLALFLIKAMKGEVPFGSDLQNRPSGATIPRMPDGFPPVADSDITFIQKWIDDAAQKISR